MSELQHSGRGRHGRRWIASFGDSIALSLAWTFGDAARASPALSLATGVAISRALARAGARGIGLKWPNDVWFDDRKLGGVLIELRVDAGGPAHVVIGVGLNALAVDGRAMHGRSERRARRGGSRGEFGEDLPQPRWRASCWRSF